MQSHSFTQQPQTHDFCDLEPALQEKKSQTGELRTILLLGIPTAFDLTATVLMNIGLLSVTARYRCSSDIHLPGHVYVLHNCCVATSESAT